MTRLTEAQLAVVSSAAGRLLVRAGAGSGKTTTVVQALCHNLGVPVVVDGAAIPAVAQPLAFDQVAAITFTNQAAADLKRKLRAALRAAGRRDLAADVDAARIGTIHGFCGDLLRDFALRAGTAPGRRVLEEGEVAALADDCARAAFRGAIERADVPGIGSLLAGRKVRDIVGWVATVSEDTDRLAKWAADVDHLRDHERALVALAQRAAALRSEWLDREGVLDFDRMITATRALLQSTAVRRAVQQRLRLLIVDEFQDADPAQRDLAYLLGGLHQPDPQPTRVVLVGDPKQSIYRFRRADVTSWTTVAEDFEGGAGAVLPLGENFRSKAAILGVVDATVGRVMARPVADDGTRGAFEVDYAALDARAEGAGGDRAVEILVVPAAPDGKARNANEVRDMEAAAVARRIVALHDSGTPFGDVAILLTGWGDVQRYEGALRRAGVPSYALRSEGFWETREVLDCLLALRAVRDPDDDVALMGFLKSPFVGLRDDTLLAVARQARRDGLSAALERAASERPLLDRAVALLATLRAVRDRVSTHELLRRLLRESGYVAAAALDGDEGQQRVANLRKLVRLTSASPDQSLGEFLRDVAEQRARKDRVAPERLYRERADVVTITSVHSAKGLEWPTVFWCDLVREAPPTKDKLLLGRGTLSVKEEAVEADEEDAADARHAALVAELALEERAEAYRLWYVASTRAKERLVLSGIPLGVPNKSGFSPARMLREAFPALEPDVDAEYVSDAGVAYHAVVSSCEGITAPAQPAPPGAPALTLTPVRVAAPVGGLRLSATQLMAFEQDPRGWRDRYVLRFDGAGAGSLSRAAASSIATGLVVHDVLERFETEGDDLAELIESAIADRGGDAPDGDGALGAAYRAYVRARIDAAISSPAWLAVARSPSAKRELSFTRLLGQGAAITGALDLAAREETSAHVLDVKTSTAGANALARRYAVQAAVYCDAVRAIAGVEQVGFTLLAVPDGIAVDVVPTEDVQSLVAKLRAWTGAAGAGGAP